MPRAWLETLDADDPLGFTVDRYHRNSDKSSRPHRDLESRYAKAFADIDDVKILGRRRKTPKCLNQTLGHLSDRTCRLLVSLRGSYNIPNDCVWVTRLQGLQDSRWDGY